MLWRCLACSSSIISAAWCADSGTRFYSFAPYEIFSRLLEKRIIFLNRPIFDDMAAGIIAQLLFLDSDKSKKPIQLYINSPGGAITDGLAIYDMMQYINTPIMTTCLEQVIQLHGSGLPETGSHDQCVDVLHHVIDR